MAAPSSPGIWFSRYEPAETNPLEEQTTLASDKWNRFKEAIINAEQKGDFQRLELKRSLPSIQQLVTNDTRLSWPLNAFSESQALPPLEEQYRLGDLCLTGFRTHCPPLDEMCARPRCSPPLQLALAALGACLSRSKDWYAIWTDTNRLLVTSIAVHKSQFQSQMIFLAWILHETAAIMGDSPGVVRPVTMAHAFIGGAMRRSWRWQRLPADQRQMSSTSGPLLLLTLQNDLLRSIYFNSDLDVVALFGHRNLTPFTDDTLDDFEAEVFDSHFLDISSQGPELSLLTLLLIWNQILVQCSIACCGRGGSKCETSKTSVLMLTMDQEIRLARHRASRALSNWSSSHYEEASMELRALYHFCAMSLTLPSLRMLYLPFGSSSSTLKGGEGCLQDVLSNASFFETSLDTDSAKGSVSSSMAPIQIPEEAVRHSWLVLDCVSAISADSPALATPFLPAIVFTTALCLRKHLVSCNGTRAQGSLQVLKLFAAELERLPWRCCPAMAKTLTQSIRLTSISLTV